MVRGSIRPTPTTGARWVALAAWGIARTASAQTVPPPSVPYLSPPTLRLELAAPERVSVKIRPETGGVEQIAAWPTCPPACWLVVYPGRYRLDADPPKDSGLRPVRSTFAVSTDARVRIAPGSSSEHGWGLGLTIAGSVLLTFGLILGFTQSMGEDDPSKKAVALGMMGLGAPLTGGGIYLLVHGRNRIIVEPTWPSSVAPPAPSSEAHVGVGGKF